MTGLELAQDRPAGRPAFIPADIFRTPLSGSVLNRYFRVGNIQAKSFVDKCARTGRPIRSFRGWHRPLDVVSRARAEGLEVAPPMVEEIKQSIAEARSEVANLRKEIAHLRDSAQHEKHMLEIRNASTRLTGATLLREEEIVSARLDLMGGSGIYFLISGERVVYVGQSVNVFARVRQHLSDKEFDSYAYILADAGLLNVLESLYIHTLRPPLNGQGSINYVPAPLKLSEILAMSPPVHGEKTRHNTRRNQ